MQKAKTPILNAYGLNCDYVDSNGTQFAEVIDGMTDISGIIDCGYEIKASKITRSLFKNDVVIRKQKGNVVGTPQIIRRKCIKISS